MVKNKISATDLDDDVYVISPGKISKIVFLVIILFFIGILSRFSLKETTATLIANAINSNRSCSLSYEKIEVSFFLPSVILRNANINGICMGNLVQSLALGDVKLFLHGPSFSPLGLKFKTEIQTKKSEINLYIAAGLSSQAIRIEDSTIDSELIKKFINGKFNFNGSLLIDAVVKFSDQKFNSGNFFVKSKNLTIPSQKISGFDLPSLPIQNLVFKGNLNFKNPTLTQLDILTLEAGSNDSPILGKLDGTIKLNSKYTPGSEIALTGKLKFSQTFLDSFSIMSLFLGGKSTDKEGYYNLNILGTLAAPKPKFL